MVLREGGGVRFDNRFDGELPKIMINKDWLWRNVRPTLSTLHSNARKHGMSSVAITVLNDFFSLNIDL